MEHRPWIGPAYADGIRGQKLLLAGFSHWGRYSETEDDNPGFTENVVTKWAKTGEISFFNRLAAYFGESDVGNFLDKVAFMNTLPTTVGDDDQRYAAGSAEQRAAVKNRVLRVIEDLAPDRIFVFTKKGWALWPDYTGSLTDGTLLVKDVGEYDAGSYKHKNGEALAFGFLHPQFTPIEPTKRAVAAAIEATTETLRRGYDHS